MVEVSRTIVLLVILGCSSGASRVERVATPSSPSNEALDRPRPYPVFETPAFARAVELGTRTRAGRPGPRYWQQRAEYRLEAELDPAANRLIGRGTVRYHNRSPDTLRNVYVHLYQNLFAPNAVRNELVPVTAGTELSSVVVSGRTLSPLDGNDHGPGYETESTILRIRLPSQLLPGAFVELDLAWAFAVPKDGAPRMGQDGEVWYLAYWYPQVAVYDDLTRRWQTDVYMGNSEFYMGYGDYDVSITVPAGWLVAATGTLQNPEEVLSRCGRCSARRCSIAPTESTANGGSISTLPRMTCATRSTT